MPPHHSTTYHSKEDAKQNLRTKQIFVIAIFTGSTQKRAMYWSWLVCLHQFSNEGDLQAPHEDNMV